MCNATIAICIIFQCLHPESLCNLLSLALMPWHFMRGTKGKSLNNAHVCVSQGMWSGQTYETAYYFPTFMCLQDLFFTDIKLHRLAGMMHRSQNQICLFLILFTVPYFYVHCVCAAVWRQNIPRLQGCQKALDGWIL